MNCSQYCKEKCYEHFQMAYITLYNNSSMNTIVLSVVFRFGEVRLALSHVFKTQIPLSRIPAFLSLPLVAGFAHYRGLHTHWNISRLDFQSDPPSSAAIFLLILQVLRLQTLDLLYPKDLTHPHVHFIHLSMYRSAQKTAEWQREGFVAEKIYTLLS